MIVIRDALVKDMNALKDIDLRSYQYPLSQDTWSRVLVDSPCKVFLATIGTRTVGFIVLEAHETRGLQVQRLAVSALFRGKGIATELLAKAESLARDLHIDKLSATVPEIHCLPGDPDDISLWLKFKGFRAVGIRRGFYHMYGDYLDGFVFEREV